MEKIDAIKKANFWNSSFTKVGIDRRVYMSKIKSYVGNQLIKVLVGQRRTGKSYLLRQIMQVLVEEMQVPVENILYINKENLEFDFIMHYSDLDEVVKLYLKELKPKGKVYLFFDEIQQIAGWEKLVTAYAQSYKEDYEVFITGSNSDLLSSELATRLTGRYVQFQIFPFSYEEYLQLNKQDSGKNSYAEYLSFSGLPELYRLPNEESRRHYLSALTDTIVLRDIVERYAVRDVAMLKDLFSFLVNNVSNLVSVGNIVNYLKTKYGTAKYDTVAMYVGYFVNAYLAHEVPRYNLKGKALMSGVRKYYLNDLGYKNLLYSGYKHGYGYLLENLVYLQLKRNAYEVYVGSNKGKEIDFVALKNDQTLYVQVAYTIEDETTKEREYASLLSVKDNYPKIVVTMDDLAHPDYMGIKHVLVWELEAYLLA